MAVIEGVIWAWIGKVVHYLWQGMVLNIIMACTGNEFLGLTQPAQENFDAVCALHVKSMYTHTCIIQINVHCNIQLYLTALLLNVGAMKSSLVTTVENRWKKKLSDKQLKQTMFNVCRQVSLCYIYLFNNLIILNRCTPKLLTSMFVYFIKLQTKVTQRKKIQMVHSLKM